MIPAINISKNTTLMVFSSLIRSSLRVCIMLVGYGLWEGKSWIDYGYRVLLQSYCYLTEKKLGG